MKEAMKMKHDWKRGVGVLAMMAMAAVIWAQDAPADQKEESEETAIPVKYNRLSFGYNTYWGHPSGNPMRLWQNGRMYEGLGLHELRFFGPWGEKNPYFLLGLKGDPSKDMALEAALALCDGQMLLKGYRTRNSNNGYDLVDVGLSQDDITRFTADRQLGPNLGAFYLYDSRSRDQSFPGPRPNGVIKTHTNAVGVGGNLLNGRAGITYSDSRTNDYKGTQPGTVRKSWDLNYAGQFSGLGLEGSYGYTRIEQSGWKSSSITSMALRGEYDLGPNTNLQFHFGRDDLDIPITQNATVQKRFSTGVRVNQKLFNKWNLQVGYTRKESERLRANHTFVDVPKSNVWDARLTGRLTPYARLTARLRWDDLVASAGYQTPDPRQLQWDDNVLFQAKLDGGTDLLSYYAVYTYRFRQNRTRETEINWNNWTVGGSYQFTPTLSGFLELSQDSLLAGGAESGGVRLDDFFPSSRSIAAGLTWVRDENMSLSTSLNLYETNNSRYSQLNLNYRRRLSPDHELELMFSPWRFDDRLYDVTGYKATLASARMTIRF